MRKLSASAKLVRDGLFLAASRPFGEEYIENFVRACYGLRKPDRGSYDAVDSKGIRYEIKAARALRPRPQKSGSKTILERIQFENQSLVTNRLVRFDECRTAIYDANIQNIKRDHFDILTYLVLFEDCVKVFDVKRAEISSMDGWSKFHGLYDVVGKSGQFSVRRGNIEWHLQNYLVDSISYPQMRDVYASLSRSGVNE